MTKNWSSSDLWRYGLWLLIIIVAIAYYPRFIKYPGGMALYPAAARCLQNHKMLQACDPGFTYPPILAFLMLPFEPMPLWLRYLVWYLITLAAVIGSFRISEKVAQSAIARPLTAVELSWMRLIVLLLSSKLILSVFEFQAYDALLVLFVLLGLAALVAGRKFGAGASLAFAAALKATPLIFLPYLLWKRHFIAAATFAVVFIAASYLPDLFFTPTASEHGYFNTWLREVAGASLGIDPGNAKFAFRTVANVLNHSLRGAVSLNIDETARRALYRIVLFAVDGTFIVVVGTLLVLSPRRRASIAVDGSLLLISMLMLSPMTSRSHYIALLLPYMTLVTLGFRDERTANLGRAVMAASFVLVTLTSNDAVGQAVTEWAYGHSFLVLGTLVLLIYFAVLVIRRYRNDRLAHLPPVQPSIDRTPDAAVADYRRSAVDQRTSRR
ncbi:MAG TPA: glycosyltransferase family 87 protein [Xanthobacteraceae bacterium]|nr:glycosyltransferase family 87 protein [Xanthobacteraceae bacterium]